MLVSPPRVIEKKNPTHVDVHSGQLMSSPKNFECLPIKFLKPSNIEPYTRMVVIPYALTPHSISVSII